MIPLFVVFQFLSKKQQILPKLLNYKELNSKTLDHDRSEIGSLFPKILVVKYT